MRSLDVDRDIARGALVGAWVGDAAGAILEFHGRDIEDADVARALSFPGGGGWGVAPGQITDDGELTCALAGAIADAGRFDDEAIAQAYAGWYRSRPFDIGQTTARAFGLAYEPSRGRLADVMRATARDYSLGSKANGSLMRATPLGVLGAHRSPERIAALAEADSTLSHPNPSCVGAVACYAIAIASLIEQPGDRARAWARAAAWGHAAATDEVREWLDLAERDEDVAYTPQVGFVRIAFVHAFRHLRRGTPFTAALEETLLGGGDTDTNACIVGGLLGAAAPHEIPPAWASAVLTADPQRGRPRPDRYHPRHVEAWIDGLLRAEA